MKLTLREAVELISEYDEYEKVTGDYEKVMDYLVHETLRLGNFFVFDKNGHLKKDKVIIAEAKLYTEILGNLVTLDIDPDSIEEERFRLEMEKL